MRERSAARRASAAAALPSFLPAPPRPLRTHLQQLPLSLPLLPLLPLLLHPMHRCAAIAPAACRAARAAAERAVCAASSKPPPRISHGARVAAEHSSPAPRGLQGPRAAGRAGAPGNGSVNPVFVTADGQATARLPVTAPRLSSAAARRLAAAFDDAVAAKGGDAEESTAAPSKIVFVDSPAGITPRARRLLEERGIALILSTVESDRASLLPDSHSKLTATTVKGKPSEPVRRRGRTPRRKRTTEEAQSPARAASVTRSAAADWAGPSDLPRNRPHSPFRLVAPYEPAGSQPEAIRALLDGLTGRHGMRSPRRFMTLAGITGCGKSFIAANVIARCGKPALVLAPNKILAAQLCDEFREYFPDNSVNYFVSYYSHYRPEAYMPASDTFIAKSSTVDDDIDRLRHLATRSLVERRDVIVVASVSCIYGLGLPGDYLRSAVRCSIGARLHGGVERLCDILKELRYTMADESEPTPARAKFSVLSGGRFVEVCPPWEQEGTTYRIELQEDIVVGLYVIDANTGKGPQRANELVLYPASHYVSSRERLMEAMVRIKQEKAETVDLLTKQGKVMEAQRLEERVNTDLHLLEKVGYCAGIENYSMHLAGRAALEPPETLLDFFPSDGDWLLFVDESHVTVPQLSTMHSANYARKQRLIQHGFRMPSALENRPLSFDEFWRNVPQAVFMSATPGAFELANSEIEAAADEGSDSDAEDGGVVEAVLRPTGVLDPVVDVVPSAGQMDHLVLQLARTVARGERALITTLTKKGAEDLAEYLNAQPPVPGILERRLAVTFLHSDIDSVGRMEILDAMHMERRRESTSADIAFGEEGGRVSVGVAEGEVEPIDVICGVNLLREGLSLPSVSLVAILDADKEGFLRSTSALLQTIGRAARNVNGRAILYADRETGAMREALAATARRRHLQEVHNARTQMAPSTVVSASTAAAACAAALIVNAPRKNSTGGGVDGAPVPRECAMTLLQQLRLSRGTKKTSSSSSSSSSLSAWRARTNMESSPLTMRTRRPAQSSSRTHAGTDWLRLESCDAGELMRRMEIAVLDEDFEMAALVRDRMLQLRQAAL